MIPITNAQLIDAAPDLLEALTAIVATHYDDDGIIVLSTASDIVGVDRHGTKQLKGSFIAQLERARAAITKAGGTL